MASGEDKLIARYFKPLAKHPGAFRLTDDVAAIAPPPGCDVVINTDGLIAGVHFFPDDPPEDVGRRALRVNISDLAAKGATPLGFVLSIALPKDVPEAWIAGFARGLGADADAYRCPLLGGDTDSTPGPISISVTALGTLPTGKLRMRSGAQVGQHMFVTGTIGDAALGLQLRRDAALAKRWGLDQAMCDHLVSRYRSPQPRVALTEAILLFAAASMDVSDGLVGDLAKLCRVSNVSADVEIARVPLSDAAARALAADDSLIEPILTGGEDYEMLFTIHPPALSFFLADAAKAGVQVTDIGRIVAGDASPRFLDRNGAALAFVSPSYSHF